MTPDLPDHSVLPATFAARSRRGLLTDIARWGLMSAAALLGACDDGFGVKGGTQARVGSDEIQGRLYDLAAKGDVDGLFETIQEMKASNLDLDVRNSKGLRALDIAAINDHGLAARALVVGGSDIRAADAKGNTVMHFAARAEAISTIRQLMSFLPDLKARNSAGQTPADVARAKSRPDIAAVLFRPNS
jgi:ankyrin repeat protein